MTKLMLIFILTTFSLIAAADNHITLTPDQLEWKEGLKSLPPGSQVAMLEGDPSKKGPFTIRLKFPANYKIMPHWHPAIEHITVIEGKFHMGAGEKMDEAKAHALPVGGFAVMPIKFRHFAFTTDQTATVQLHGIGPWDIIYVNPADDPRKQK